jgi:formate/nitrite transporter FocA (FNT family)
MISVVFFSGNLINLRGSLSGALLGFATCLAFTASKQTTLPIVGALIFPVGFVLIVLLGLELVAGNFALGPVPSSVPERLVVDAEFMPL